MFPADKRHFRAIRLAEQAGRLVITPHRSQNTSTLTLPLTLPHLPLSLMQWCGAAAERFWKREHASLSIALLLDLPLRRWIHAIPTQTCRRQDVKWKFKTDPYLSTLPLNLVLAGSFTSAPPGLVADAMDRAPKFDGVHAVHQRCSRSKGRRTWLFVRCEGRLMLADPSKLITDDLDAALREAAERIQLQ